MQLHERVRRHDTIGDAGPEANSRQQQVFKVFDAGKVSSTTGIEELAPKRPECHLDESIVNQPVFDEIKADIAQVVACVCR
jgi:hypothetical protein